MSDFDIFNIETSVVKTRMSDYSWTFYGIGGAGKSSLAAKFPKPLFFQFEVGQNALRVKKTPPIKSWSDFKKHITSLEKGKKAGKEIPYLTFVIDTADVAWKYCTKFVCGENGWEHPSDADFGKGWETVANEWFEQLDRLQKLSNDDSQPLTIINILHEKEKEIKHKSLGKYHKISPNVPKGGMAVVFDKVDFVMYFGAEQVKNADGSIELKNRYVRTRENGFIEAKSRLSQMAEEFSLGANSIESFEILKSEFDRACNLQVAEENSFDAYADETGDKPKKAAEKSKKADEKAKAEEKPKNKAKEEVEEKVDTKTEGKAEKKTSESASAEVTKTVEVEQEVAEGTEDDAEDGNYSLESDVAEIKVLAVELTSGKKLSSQEMKALIAEHTSVAKISDINDANEAHSLLLALKAV